MEPYVLIAEPHDDLRVVLCMYLTRSGFRVEVAATADEAMTWAGRESPHAIVVELNMLLGGPGLLDELRALSYPEVCVIVTSNARYDDEAALSAKGLTLLKKPYSSEAILAELARCGVPRMHP